MPPHVLTSDFKRSRPVDVRVELSGPPSSGYDPEGIDWGNAPNAEICDRYWGGEVGLLEVDVLRASTSAVRMTGWKEALASLVAVRKAGVTANTEFYTAVISTLVQHHQIDEALKVLQEMRRNESNPNAITYNVLIRACEEAERFETAKGLRDAMAWEGIARNAEICAKYKHQQTRPEKVQRYTMARLRNATWAEAKLCLHAMRTIADIEPDREVCRAAVRTYPKEDLALGARKILGDLEDVGIQTDLTTLGQVIAACEEAGLSEVSAGLLIRGVQLKIFKPQLGYSPSTNVLDLHGAEVVVREAPNMVSFSMAKALVNFHRGQEKIDQHTKFIIGSSKETKDAVVQCMRDTDYAPVVLINRDGTLNKGRLECGHLALPRCLRNEQIASALSVFDEMMEQGIVPDLETCIDLIHASVRDGRPNAAKAVCDGLQASKLAPKVAFWNVMIETCGRYGWIDDALAAYNEMLAKDVRPNADSYFAVIAARQHGGEHIDRIKEVIDLAVQEGIFLPALGRSGSVVSFRTSDIIVAQAEGVPEPAMSLHVAEALFEYHRTQGHLVQGIQISIPADADPAIKDAIKRLILEMRKSAH